MTLRAVLRGVAVVIAVLGAIDPAVMLARRVREPLVVAVDDAHAAAVASVSRVRELLQDDYDVRVREVAADRRQPACGTDELCVLVGGERWPREAVDRRARVVAAIRVEPPPGPRVAIARVTSPTTTYATAVGRLLVDIAGQETAGYESTIDVFDGDIPVGRAGHRWDANGAVTIPVDWWPIAPGPRHLSIRTSQTGDGVNMSDRVDVGVEVQAAPYNVLVYDTRPSWSSTFVRRAIEHDARLALRVVAGVSPRVQVSGGVPFRLDEGTLTDASAVIVGAPEELSARDVETLERFVRVRGGSLILVPDRRPAGPSTRLMPSRATERLEPTPVQVGEWRASELLLFPKPGAELEVLAKVGDDAIVLAAPSGAGRIIVSGAMDAWRYRDADEAAFDRAWQSLVADAAAAGGRPLDVTLDRGVARPADEVRATVRLRAMTAADAAVAVGGTVTCGQEAPRLLRLWPTGDRRRFEARFAPSAPGTCHVAVSSSAPVVATASAGVLVRHDIRSETVLSTGSVPTPGEVGRMETVEQIVSALGAQVFSAGDETTLARDVRRMAPAVMTSSEVKLMRSPWWIVPFAGCLGVEWWLRRRQGMR